MKTTVTTIIIVTGLVVALYAAMEVRSCFKTLAANMAPIVQTIDER